LEDKELQLSAGDDPEALYDRRKLGEQVESAMANLDENYRVALELRYMGERSYDEIAELMGLPVGTVKTYIHRGKVQLKKIMMRRSGVSTLDR
jgi:RNA polymerase sigma-70 factor (ECF subfamily)